MLRERLLIVELAPVAYHAEACTIATAGMEANIVITVSTVAVLHGVRLWVVLSRSGIGCVAFAIPVW